MANKLEWALICLRDRASKNDGLDDIRKTIVEEMHILESKIGKLKECVEFYAEDENPENIKDYEQVCSIKCKDALKRSGHHHVECEIKYGKLARQTLKEVNKL